MTHFYRSELNRYAHLPRSTTRKPRRRASLLLLVLVALAALTLGTGAYLVLMQGEHRAVRRHGRQSQCVALAESGVAFVQTLLAKSDQDLMLAGGPFDNPSDLKGALVADTSLALDRGRFSIVAPAMVDGVYSGCRFGLEDESAKLNLNSLLVAGGSGSAPGMAGQASASGGQSGPAAPQGGAAGGATGGQAGVDEVGPRTRLMALPGMTIEIADAILDWLDPDALPRTNGAEGEYYQTLVPPYVPKNGPLVDLDELLQVRGVTPELLYGLDQNRNFKVDAAETPRGALVELDNSTGELNRGWSAYLTVEGVESFAVPLGGPRPSVNGPNLQALYTELGKTLTDDQAKFIILARQYGLQPAAGAAQGGAAGMNGATNPGPGPAPPPGNPAPGQSGATGGAPVAISAVTLDLQKQAGANINSLLDLVGATVVVAPQPPPGQGAQPGGGQVGGGQPVGIQPIPSQSPRASSSGGQPGANQQPQTVASPWKDGAWPDLLKLYDAATAATGTRIGGRININAAPRAVLRTLPGIDLATVEQIVQRREAPYDPVAGPHRHAIWLLVESAVNLQTMRQLEPYVTAGGNVFSGQAIGYFDAGGDLARLHFVVDRTGPTPVVVKLENLSPLGRGFAPVELGAVDDSASTAARP